MNLVVKLITVTFMALPIVVLSLATPGGGAQSLGAAPAAVQQGLTNSDIIKLQSAGSGESIILSSVNTQPSAYDTSLTDCSVSKSPASPILLSQP
jgi:hypothetical protein